MAEHLLEREIMIERPRNEVFDFFSDTFNLERITPPELKFDILTPGPISMHEGTLIDYKLSVYGLPFTWRTEISEWDPPNRFVDRQLSGPYSQWIHTHTFDDLGPSTTRIRDEVRYRLPLEPLGDLFNFIVDRQLAGIFDHRQKIVAEILGDQ